MRFLTIILGLFLFIPAMPSDATAAQEARRVHYKRKRILKKRAYRTYYVGKRGGCYYLNANGNNTYVDRSFCRK